MKAERLLDQFADRAIRHPDGVVLRTLDALALVTRASEEGVPVVGVQSFRVGPTSAEPALDEAAFFPGYEDGHGCWSEAESFIRSRDQPDLAFAVVLGDDPLEAV